MRHRIPLMRPLLPPSRDLQGYLQRIDESRIYTNNGPLVAAFEERLGALFDLGRESVATVSSATSGLSLCLLALARADHTDCVMPAWTFEATPVAAVRAGLQPVFLDVSEGTWSLEPKMVRTALAEKNAAAVVVVSPFGVAGEGGPWESLSRDSGTPVVFDCGRALTP